MHFLSVKQKIKMNLPLDDTFFAQIFIAGHGLDVVDVDLASGQLRLESLVLLLQVLDQLLRRVLVHRRLRLDLLGSIS